MTLGQLFKDKVIKPALERLDKLVGGKGKMSSESAVNLILMIVAHESGLLTYAKQIRGPALGFAQMEPATFTWLLEWLGRNRPSLLMALSKFGPVENDSAEFMVMCPQYAVVCARLNLLRFAEPLPDANDLDGLARYAKKYWNTSAGKATEADYLTAYQTFLGEAA